MELEVVGVRETARASPIGFTERSEDRPAQLDNHFVTSICVFLPAGEPPDRKKPMPPRHRFLEPIHNVKERGEPLSPRGEPREDLVFISGNWWSQPGSNRRPQACKASALPTELWPLRDRKVQRFGFQRSKKTLPFGGPKAVVGRVGVEPTTSRLSGVRSNHLSYRPPRLLAVWPQAA